MRCGLPIPAAGPPATGRFWHPFSERAPVLLAVGLLPVGHVHPHPRIVLFRTGAVGSGGLVRAAAAVPVPAGVDLVGPALVRTGLRPRLAARECEPQDRALNVAELLGERAAVVGQLVALADLLDLRCDLRVAGGGHVRIEVVLHLVAEVPRGDVEERAALDVRRAAELAHVPATTRLVLDLLLAERVGLVGEVAAEDDRVGPDIPDGVGDEVRLRRGPERPDPALQRITADFLPLVLALEAAAGGLNRAGGEAGDRGPGDVVLDDLGARLAGDPLDLALDLVLVLLAGADGLEVEVVECASPLKRRREQ